MNTGQQKRGHDLNPDFHDAMRIARYFSVAHQKAKITNTAIAELLSCAWQFMSDEDAKVLRDASNVIDKITKKSGEWEAATFLANELENIKKEPIE